MHDTPADMGAAQTSSVLANLGHSGPSQGNSNPLDLLFCHQSGISIPRFFKEGLNQSPVTMPLYQLQGSQMKSQCVLAKGGRQIPHTLLRLRRWDSDLFSSSSQKYSLQIFSQPFKILLVYVRVTLLNDFHGVTVMGKNIF